MFKWLKNTLRFLFPIPKKWTFENFAKDCYDHGYYIHCSFAESPYNGKPCTLDECPYGQMVELER